MNLKIFKLSSMSIGRETEPLDLINTVFNMDNIFKAYFQSISNILLILGICGTIMTFLVYSLICMVKSNNPESLRNFKENVTKKIGLLIFLFNITTFAGIAKKIAESLM